MVTLSLPLKRCGQCWRYRSRVSFVGARGREGNWCAGCRAKYRGWEGRSLTERLGARGPRRDDVGTGRVMFSRRSGNAKTGPIPVSMSERGTCPPSCGLYDAGCYADYGKLAAHWRAVGARGMAWEAFLASVRRLPAGQLWRHNEAGDLAGNGQELDVEQLVELVEANRGRRGFTFTHKHAPAHYEALQWSNLEGFTVNLSADSLEAADALYQDDDDVLTKAGPVAVILPHDAPATGVRTPQGRRVVVCPAQTHGMSCADCQLCSHPFRASIVGFRAHGQFKKHVPELVQLRRKGAAA